MNAVSLAVTKLTREGASRSAPPAGETQFARDFRYGLNFVSPHVLLRVAARPPTSYSVHSE
jgi:hypothetical protein